MNIAKTLAGVTHTHTHTSSFNEIKNINKLVKIVLLNMV